MPFKLGTRTIQLDTPFTHDDIQYPANWIRLATEEDKSAIGLVWEADPVRYDDRYYWNGDINNPKALENREESDQDGNPLYIQVYDATANDGKGAMVNTDKRLISKGLKANFIVQIKHTAGTILAQTDWMVIRKAERNVDIPSAVATYRASVVAKVAELETAISAVTTVEQLIALDLSFPSEA
jgi:hypothetical protein